LTGVSKAELDRFASNSLSSLIPPERSLATLEKVTVELKEAAQPGREIQRRLGAEAVRALDYPTTLTGLVLPLNPCSLPAPG